VCFVPVNFVSILFVCECKEIIDPLSVVYLNNYSLGGDNRLKIKLKKYRSDKKLVNRKKCTMEKMVVCRVVNKK